jgi:hypothetical protein
VENGSGSSSQSNVIAASQLEPAVIFLLLLLSATADPPSTPPSCDGVEGSFASPGGGDAPFGVSVSRSTTSSQRASGPPVGASGGATAAPATPPSAAAHGTPKGKAMAEEDTSASAARPEDERARRAVNWACNGQEKQEQ